jgi:hypothetical protein
MKWVRTIFQNRSDPFFLHFFVSTALCHLLKRPQNVGKVNIRVQCSTVPGHYERDGEIKNGGASINSPSKAEAARQGRMKREVKDLLPPSVR